MHLCVYKCCCFWTSGPKLKVRFEDLITFFTTVKINWINLIETAKQKLIILHPRIGTYCASKGYTYRGFVRSIYENTKKMWVPRLEVPSAMYIYIVCLILTRPFVCVRVCFSHRNFLFTWRLCTVIHFSRSVPCLIYLSFDKNGLFTHAAK